ncbi:TPA: hypothetical protein HA265_02055 [Candidatus Woesearchaeota archaeon]|nr:hypothetical protein [Candidatus Woesearchaeota archaeon]
MVTASALLNMDEPLSDLADLLQEAVFNTAETVRLKYADAILVLRYMDQEYAKVESGHQEKVPDHFISQPEFHTLFSGSSDYMLDLSKAEVGDSYRRCSGLYSRLVDLTERHASDVSQKRVDINAAKSSLRNMCQGRPLSRIDPQRDCFREQY